MPGPPNKWVKDQISTTADANAQTSTQGLATANNFPISSSFVAVCSDGTFLFVGWYV